MNQTSGIAVIATSLPYTDRRALSQAWFSALHLASDGPLSPRPPERRNVFVTVVPSGARTAARASQPSEHLARATDGSSKSKPAGGAVEPKRSASSTAVRTAGAAYSRARSYATFRTSLTLGVGGERVALLLRRDGATLHVIALCRPAVAEVVRRALACADVHLRAHGEAITARVEVLERGAVA